MIDSCYDNGYMECRIFSLHAVLSLFSFMHWFRVAMAKDHVGYHICKEMSLSYHKSRMRCSYSKKYMQAHKLHRGHFTGGLSHDNVTKICKLEKRQKTKKLYALQTITMAA